MMGLHRNLELKFQAEISLSMAQALLQAFEGRSEEQTLILESRDFGLWLLDQKTGIRMCLGSAVPLGGKC
ncbi:hypothetical protein [Paracoccus laeviglucosivorans]|uniref:Uncharacterized protein n=1 Tax=Paracoccus laeviglucosivorans TaxID=1197861 RepID=A0A521FVC7_9RHOB|nr:hypothetical protein [Paracoccus laeviglucosivorans]SMP00117.1 hypothetical protein SAMN06265221_1613 [Paracoccus laeviglucosivorans]